MIWHPLVALDALSITMNTRKVTKEHAKNPLLDEYNTGGKLDAFRHVFWMASLSAEIKWKKAWRLGNAHEKANKKDWRKGRYEDGSPPDKIAGEMDYWNNKIGLDIGKSNQSMSEEDLIQLVIRASQQHPEAIRSTLSIIPSHWISLILVSCRSRATAKLSLHLFWPMFPI